MACSVLWRRSEMISTLVDTCHRTNWTSTNVCPWLTFHVYLDQILRLREWSLTSVCKIHDKKYLIQPCDRNRTTKQNNNSQFRMWWLFLVIQRWTLQHLVCSRKYAELMESGPTDKGNDSFLPTVCLLHQLCLPMLSQPTVLTANEDYLMVITVNICVNKMRNTEKCAGGWSIINSRRIKDLSTGLLSLTSTQEQQL